MFQLFLLFILGVDWASGYAIAGYCMRHGVSPYGYSFWQSFGPMILLLLIQLAVFRKISLDKRGITYILLGGVSGILIPNLLIYLASGHVQSGLLTVICNISPLLVYVFALLYKEERFNFIRGCSVMVGLIGILMIVWTKIDSINVGPWLLAALLIPSGYAFCTVYVSKFRPLKGTSLDYAFGMLLIAAIFNIPLVYLKNGFYPLHINDLNTWLIVLEIMLSALGYVLLFVIIKMVGAVYYTLVNIITALTGIIYGYFIFNQYYPITIYLAIIMVLISLFGLTVTQQNKSG